MIYYSPAKVQEQHIKNNQPSVGVSERRFCYGCKKQRSIAQFWNKTQNPVYEVCRECRGRR
jgi:hypothetical protein